MIYLDNNATTPLDPRVREAMLPFLGDSFGNPSSPYALGRDAALAIDRARESVAGLIDATPAEIVFTGCGTESNNAAIRSMIALSGVEGLAAAPPRKNLVMTRVEHASVLNLGAHFEKEGIVITWLDVNGEGHLDLDQLRSAITPETAGVSIMAANNETGILFPIAEAAAIAHERGTLFHTDAVQAAGKIPFSVRSIAPDYVSLGAHKLHGPKGVGALYLRKGVPSSPMLIGGDQEQGRRAGTENVAGIVGFGKAAELARENLGAMASRVRRLRDHHEDQIGLIGRIRPIGQDSERLPNTSLFLIDGIDSEALLALLDMDGIACSSGSACASGANEPSHVLRAMGIPAAQARGALRVSLSRFTVESELERGVSAIIRHAVKLRSSANI